MYSKLKQVVRSILGEEYYLFLGGWRALFYYIFRLLPVNKTKVVLTNFNGKGYGDNPKYIAEELIVSGLPLDLVWLVSTIEDRSIPPQIRKVKIGSIRSIYELVTAKVWIDNNRKSYDVRKRKQQFYIQTWHGFIMLKKIEKDAIDKLSSIYVKNAINDSRMIDLCISNSTFFTRFLRESFWYTGEILECGLPKSDVLLNPGVNAYEAVVRKYGIRDGDRLVLFAPTFRNSKSASSFMLNFDAISDNMAAKFSGEHTIMLRLHPAMSDVELNTDEHKRVVNVSDYSDIQLLVKAADILITDYSSLMFEFGILEKPVFLYFTDFDDYQSERGVYFDLHELPFPIAETEVGVIKNIVGFNRTDYLNKVSVFNQKVIGVRESGRAAQLITMRIKEVIDNKK